MQSHDFLEKKPNQYIFIYIKSVQKLLEILVSKWS